MSTDLIHERVVGLLNLPDIVGDGCGRQEIKSVDLYSAPSATSPPMGSVRYQVTDREADGSQCGSARLVVGRAGGVDEELPTDESGYEIQAAVVYERSGSWYRIALQRGSAWMRRTDPADFEPFPELLRDKLAYLRKGWQGKLWHTPGAGSSVAISAGWMQHLSNDIPVDVLEVRVVQDRAWLHLRLKTESCGETLQGVTSATGWVPAYSPSGRPSVWFYSRGC